MIDDDEERERHYFTGTRMTVHLVLLTILASMLVAVFSAYAGLHQATAAEDALRRAEVAQQRAEADRARSLEEIAQLQADYRCTAEFGAMVDRIVLDLLDVTSGFDEARLRGYSLDPLAEQYADARRKLTEARVSIDLRLAECAQR